MCFPYLGWESDLHLHWGFAMSFYFSRCCSGKSVAIVLPLVLGCCMCKHILGLLLSCFGHARAKNNSESSCLTWAMFTISFGSSPCCLYFHHRAVNCLFQCGYVVVGLQTVGLEAGYAWETWCLGATQKKLDSWISSPQPLNSTGKGS